MHEAMGHQALLQQTPLAFWIAFHFTSWRRLASVLELMLNILIVASGCHGGSDFEPDVCTEDHVLGVLLYRLKCAQLLNSAFVFIAILLKTRGKWSYNVYYGFMLYLSLVGFYCENLVYALLLVDLLQRFDTLINVAKR
ncbi:hypothetical protein SARC_13595 [Sphaeroforma arctica JP610]|uniref:Uncharacterized protein n=1 Tax=Sphaeroforma arctica JP610 TaxID=667725 RepID=A0A0L0FBG1_9EUKA|nr:hypothetical protein SARC_13595 [Sphaeroforma arctica JP610]KNC73846.1 hypothetical protein SARC_13595 [Sphaeroforma arctica JP610]|eukprot:XP_014147748.1 hypothetical protein SARC_13595 [Sphaeroforma arctica JP610]